MSTLSHQSIESRLNLYQISLVNAGNVPELQSRLALYSYSPAKLNQLLALRQEVFDLHITQKSEYNEQFAATYAFEQAWKAAHEPYIRLVKLGRILFKDDYAVSVKLTLNEERKKSFSGWMTQARTFFNFLLSDPTVLALYAQYGITLAAINDTFNLVATAEQANFDKVQESGEAQQSTLERDTMLDTLDSAMSEFYAIARLACEDAPQLLEVLGIVVKA